MQKNNYFIFTGGPGSGKTSVISALRAQGYTTVEEVARDIIQTQNKIGGNATHSEDQHAFCQLMLQASIKNYHAQKSNVGPVFFDRGIPGLAGYSKMIAGVVNDQVAKAANQYRYNTYVFCFTPWQEIYENDNERKQDFTEAVETYNKVKQTHLELGYIIIELPKVSVTERVEFILNAIAQLQKLEHIREVDINDGSNQVSIQDFTSCLVLTYDNKLLLQQRGDSWSSSPGYLSAFGGKVESGETPVQAIIRELKEELGAVVNENNLVSLGALTEQISQHQDVIHEFFWHDMHHTITGCYEGEAIKFDTVQAVLAHPKIIDDVLWLITEASIRQLL